MENNQASTDSFTVLTVAEIASRLRVSKMTVYRLIHDGSLQHVRVGRSYRVSERVLRAYLKL
jgi:excisionase family DNA binding protein